MPLSLTWADLPALFQMFEHPGRWLPILQRHWALIEAAAPRVSVTAVPGDEAVQRHYGESLELLRILESHCSPAAIADVGSGGGFPGIIFAAVRPDVRLHLIEPLQKRARLLDELATELALTNVAVHAVRAEDAGRGALREVNGAVVARAVASLPALLEYTAPLTARDGTIILPKGSRMDAELAASAAAQRALAVEFAGSEPMRPSISDTLGVMVFKKTGATDRRYPRRAGIPAKHPLGGATGDNN